MGIDDDVDLSLFSVRDQSSESTAFIELMPQDLELVAGGIRAVGVITVDK